MTAPSPGAISFPAGIHLDDGYQTVITFTQNPTVSLWEKTIKPPGMDGGEPVDQTTMRNIAWRTKDSRHLKTLTDSVFKGAYDPNIYNDILSILNVPGTITVHFPDLSSLAFYGFVQKLEFDDLAEGTQPEVSVTIVPTNFDPVAKVEAGPVLTSVSGT